MYIILFIHLFRKIIIYTFRRQRLYFYAKRVLLLPQTDPHTYRLHSYVFAFYCYFSQFCLLHHFRGT